VPVGAPNVSYPAARAHDWVALVSSVEANASCENCADPLDRSAKTRPYPYVNDAALVPCWATSCGAVPSGNHMYLVVLVPLVRLASSPSASCVMVSVVVAPPFCSTCFDGLPNPS
jgi:hypothetical protein